MCACDVWMVYGHIYPMCMFNDATFITVVASQLAWSLKSEPIFRNHMSSSLYGNIFARSHTHTYTHTHILLPI